MIRSIQEGKFHAENGSIKGYLLAIARNLCLDRLKQKPRFYSMDADPDGVIEQVADARTPDRYTDENRFQAAFEQALTRLSDLQRTILVLHELDGMPHTTIAKMLNVSVNAVTANLCRARRITRNSANFRIPAGARGAYGGSAGACVGATTSGLRSGFRIWTSRSIPVLSLKKSIADFGFSLYDGFCLIR